MKREFDNQKENHEEEVSKINKIHDMLKLEKQSIEQTYINHVLESKRDKEVITVFKNQNKEYEKNLK